MNTAVSNFGAVNGTSWWTIKIASWFPMLLSFSPKYVKHFSLFLLYIKFQIKIEVQSYGIHLSVWTPHDKPKHRAFVRWKIEQPHGRNKPNKKNFVSTEVDWHTTDAQMIGFIGRIRTWIPMPITKYWIALFFTNQSEYKPSWLHENWTS